MADDDERLSLDLTDGLHFSKRSTDKYDEYNDGLVKENMIAELDEVEKSWIEGASSGGLDVFTVSALALGENQYQELKDMVAKLMAILVLQVFIPIMMVYHQVSFAGYRPYPREDSWTYRAIGFTIFIYSIFNIYSNTEDDCRSQFQDLAIRKCAGWRYFFPVLVGETINALSGVALTVCLFNIFCRASRPEDLVLNSVGMNYIGNIDNEFVDSFTQKVAISRFCSFVAEGKKVIRSTVLPIDASWSVDAPTYQAVPTQQSSRRHSMDLFIPSNGEVSSTDQTWHYARIFISTLLKWIKIIGVLIFGFVLGFAFLLSHEQQLCDSIPYLHSSLLCLGIAGEDDE